MPDGRRGSANVIVVSVRPRLVYIYMAQMPRFHRRTYEMKFSNFSFHISAKQCRSLSLSVGGIRCQSVYRWLPVPRSRPETCSASSFDQIRQARRDWINLSAEILNFEIGVDIVPRYIYICPTTVLAHEWTLRNNLHNKLQT